ncbi:MAG: hypothetical protein RSE41_05365 [Clostridia bacterium]
MNTEIRDWTHKNVKILDIRKIKRFYILKLDLKDVTSSVTIQKEIFNERLEAYFLKSIENISREDIMSIKLDMFLTQGYFIKIDKNGNVSYIDKNPYEDETSQDKWYVSYFEIPGPLVSFNNIINKH